MIEVNTMWLMRLILMIDIKWTGTPTPDAKNINTPRSPLPEHPLYINEISNKGTEGVCEGKYWIQLYNNRPEYFLLHTTKASICDRKNWSSATREK